MAKLLLSSDGNLKKIMSVEKYIWIFVGPGPGHNITFEVPLKLKTIFYLTDKTMLH
jgi:hypothetical protein